jgi:hypothetical protein
VVTGCDLFDFRAAAPVGPAEAVAGDPGDLFLKLPKSDGDFKLRIPAIGRKVQVINRMVCKLVAPPGEVAALVPAEKAAGGSRIDPDPFLSEAGNDKKGTLKAPGIQFRGGQEILIQAAVVKGQGAGCRAVPVPACRVEPGERGFRKEGELPQGRELSLGLFKPVGSLIGIRDPFERGLRCGGTSGKQDEPCQKEGFTEVPAEAPAQAAAEAPAEAPAGARR